MSASSRPKSPEDFHAHLELIDTNSSLGSAEKLPKMRYLLECIMDERLSEEPYTVTGLCEKLQLVIRHQKIPYLKRDALHSLRKTANRVLHDGYCPSDKELAAGIRILAWCMETFYGLGYVPAGANGALLEGPNTPVTEIAPMEASPAGAGTLTGHDWVRGLIVAVEGEQLTVDLQAGDESLDDCTMYKAEWAESPFADQWQALRKGTPFAVMWPRLSDEGHLTGRHLIIEPDVIVDVTALARSTFRTRSATLLSPWLHWTDRLQPSGQSLPMLKGLVINGYLDRMLDDDRTIWSADAAKEDFKDSFRRHALAYTQFGREVDIEYMHDCARHHRNIHRVVRQELPQMGVTPDRISVEPAFIVPSVGLQGRLDLLANSATNGRTLLIEVKSGKLPWPKNDETAIGADHEIQLHAYQLMLQMALGVPAGRIDAFMFYSTADRPGTNLRTKSLSVSMEQKLLALRNDLVLAERELVEASGDPALLQAFIARVSADSLAGPDNVLPNFMIDKFHAVQALWNDVRTPEPVRRYALVFLGFIARERWLSQLGDGQRGYGHSALWRSDEGDPDAGAGGVELELLELDAEGRVVRFARSTPDKPMAFRRGDSILLYRVIPPGRGRWDRLVVKGAVQEIHDAVLSVRLVEAQRYRASFAHGSRWHMHSELMLHGFRGMEQALVHWLMAPPERRDVILGLRSPGTSEPWPERRLIEPEDDVASDVIPYLDHELHRALSAPGWFLLQGPPGTGKTSIALRAMVRSYYRVKADRNILVMAYTNRAVDELCGVLTGLAKSEPEFDFIRLGRSTSTDPAYADRLLDRLLVGVDSRQAVRSMLDGVRIWVTTVATAQNHMSFLASRRFAMAFIDEASQLLEPQIVGLLTLTERAVLIGDPKQLPAVVVQNPQHSCIEDPVLEPLGLTDRREAYFERLLRLAQQRQWKDHIGLLRHQGRMHPQVADWPNRHFYGGQLTMAGLKHQRTRGPVYPGVDAGGDQLLDTLCRRRMLWLDSCPVPEDHSYRVNSGEAVTVARVIERLHKRCGVSLDDIGVITPYRQQIQTIWFALDKRLPDAHGHVVVDTVERFQGSQRRIICYSFSVNDPMQLHTLTASLYEAEGEPAVDRKLNVALTRAKEQVVLIGNRDVLRRSALFNELIRHVDTYDEGETLAMAADEGGITEP